MMMMRGVLSRRKRRALSNLEWIAIQTMVGEVASKENMLNINGIFHRTTLTTKAKDLGIIRRTRYQVSISLRCSLRSGSLQRTTSSCRRVSEYLNSRGVDKTSITRDQASNKITTIL